jgi:hypothetical protein
MSMAYTQDTFHAKYLPPKELFQYLTRQAMYIEHNTEAYLRNNCCHGKAKSITYSESESVALFSQHAMHISHIILPSVACPVPPYLSTLSHKWYDLWKQVTEHKCLFGFSLQLLSATFLILWRMQWDIIINVHMPWCKVPIFLVLHE